MTNALRQLRDLGQSVWLGTADPVFIAGGALARMIDEHGVSGVSLNPAAITGGPEASQALADNVSALLAEGDAAPEQLYDALLLDVARAAADALMPVHRETEGRDGAVAIEVSPYLLEDAERCARAAIDLVSRVDRPNLVIKIPATEAGLAAISRVVGQGISVMATLIFDPEMATRAMTAYMDGLEALIRAGGDPTRVVGHCSVGLGRIDAAMDAEIDRRLKFVEGSALAPRLSALRTRFAKGVATLAADELLLVQGTKRWKALAERRANPMRPAWASTRVRSSEMHRFAYLEHSIVAQTTILIRVETAEAFSALPPVVRVPPLDRAGAEEIFVEADRLAVPFRAIARRLVGTGLFTYQDSVDGLLELIAKRRLEALGDAHSGLTITEAQPDRVALEIELASWRVLGNGTRLWRGDTDLWSGADEARWVGWLDAPADSLAELPALTRFADEVRAEGFRHVLLLGMGGSSLGPEVLGLTFPPRDGAPTLHVLDSTDPREVAAAAALIDPATTLFIVASKSGSTLEPSLFLTYFHDLARRALGDEGAARRFVAITDPGSKLEAEARALGFRWLFHGNPEIGGRYSVLSAFGMVPAAAIGMDVEAFLRSTLVMVNSCGPDAMPEVNPGLRLGIALGLLARLGRDKLTILASPSLSSLGGWLEQLIAESTGKLGLGIIPVDLEPLGAVESYGKDRVFAAITLAGEADPTTSATLAGLAEAGHPVVEIELAERGQLGQEFFRWEIATAAAGAILCLNPFDQPDVEASKIKTRELTDAVARDGGLPPETPFLSFDGITLFAEGATRAILADAPDFDAAIKRHLDQLAEGDYLGLLAYLHRTPAHGASLARIRAAVRDAKKVATVAGFGPRFLHSTGQAYKGGPASGVFLQLTATYSQDLPIPGRDYGFGVVEAAQARGDLGVLVERDRRALRVHFGDDVEAGLARLERAVMAAVA